MKIYSSREVAALLGISIRQVYAHARAGFLKPARGPRRVYRFSFQDLVLLRTARALAVAKIPARRIRRALRRLIRELPQGRSLSEVRITAEGGRIVARDGARAWNPESGQLQLDFRPPRRANKVQPIRTRVAEPTREAAALSGDQWYDRGIDLESAEPIQARRAYEQALSQDPRNADAHVNLGRLLYDQNEVGQAVEHYRKALGLKRNHSIAAFNLGIALEDLGKTNDAIVAYRRAIESDPYFADAHYNLAQLYQKTGKRTAAIRHMKSYRELKKGRKGGKTVRR